VCIQEDALRRYLFLNVNTGASLVISIARYNILSHYGFTSKEYLYFYFYSDALLTITLYFALVSLYSLVFANSRPRAMSGSGPWSFFPVPLCFLMRRPAIQCQACDAFRGGAIPEPLFRRTCSDLCLVGRRFEDA